MLSHTHWLTFRTSSTTIIGLIQSLDNHGSYAERRGYAASKASPTTAPCYTLLSYIWYEIYMLLPKNF